MGSLEPGATLLADEALPPEGREAAERRLSLWLAAHLRKVLAPLIALADAQGAPEAARSVALKVSQALGVLERERVKAEVKALDQEARGALRKLGVRFGAHYIYVPALLKPAARTLCAQLWALAQPGVDQDGAERLLHFAASGRTSFAVEQPVSAELCRIAGFRLCGDRAVRVDIVERLSDLIRAALPRSPTPGPADEADGFVVTGQMTSLTGCSGEPFASILRSLGFVAHHVKKSAYEAAIARRAAAAARRCRSRRRGARRRGRRAARGGRRSGARSGRTRRSRGRRVRRRTGGRRDRRGRRGKVGSRRAASEPVAAEAAPSVDEPAVAEVASEVAAAPEPVESAAEPVAEAARAGARGGRACGRSAGRSRSRPNPLRPKPRRRKPKLLLRKKRRSKFGGRRRAARATSPITTAIATTSRSVRRGRAKAAARAPKPTRAVKTASALEDGRGRKPWRERQGAANAPATAPGDAAVTVAAEARRRSRSRRPARSAAMAPRRGRKGDRRDDRRAARRGDETVGQGQAAAAAGRTARQPRLAVRQAARPQAAAAGARQKPVRRSAAGATFDRLASRRLVL